MLNQILELFDIQPDYDLDVMRDNQSLFGVTTRILQGLEEILKTEEPHIVLVQGDTTTAFVASLAANYQKIKVAHVEAGLRTGLMLRSRPDSILVRSTKW